MTVWVVYNVPGEQVLDVFATKKIAQEYIKLQLEELDESWKKKDFQILEFKVRDEL